MKLVYNVNEKPPIRKNLVYAFQQLLAIIAATLLVPTLVNFNNAAEMPTVMNQPAALFGAGRCDSITATTEDAYPLTRSREARKVAETFVFSRLILPG